MAREQNTDQSSGTGSSFFYGYVIAIATFFILLVAYGIRFSYGVFFAPMVMELGWSSAVTASTFSISMLIEGIFNIILGHITDKYGPRIVLTISGVLIGLGYCLLPFVHSIWQFYLFYGVILGIGMGGMFVPLMAIIARWFTDRRSLMTGLVMSGVGIGILIVSTLANQLIINHGWRTTFFIMGISASAVIIIATQFLKRDPSTMALVPYGEDSHSPEDAKTPAPGVSFKQAIRTYQFWFAYFMLFCYGFCATSISIHIVPYAINQGITATIAAAILATIGGLQIVGRIGLGMVADKIGNRNIFILGFILSAIVLFWIVTTDTTGAFFLFAVVFGFAQGGIATSQSPLVAALFGLESHGLIFGFCAFGFIAGAALGPYVTGYLFDITQSYYLAFVTSAIICLIGLAFTVPLRPIKNAGNVTRNSYI